MTSAGSRARAAATYPSGYYAEAPRGSHLHALFLIAASHNDDGTMRWVTEIDLYGPTLAEMTDRARAMAMPDQPKWFLKRTTQVEDAKCRGGHI